MKWSVPKLYPRVVVCVASGPSLNPLDIAAMENVRNSETIVIAVSDAYKWVRKPDYLYAADFRWWIRHWESVKDLDCPKVSVDRHIDPHPILGSEILTLEYETMDEPLSDNPSVLKTGNHSGFQALNIAYLMRPRSIVLLGYDLSKGPNGESHFFGEHPPDLRSNTEYVQWKHFYDGTVPRLQELQIDVYNCCLRSAITAFPKLPATEVFRSDYRVSP